MLKEKMLEAISKKCCEIDNHLTYEGVLFDCNLNFCREKIYNIYKLCEYIGKKYSINLETLKSEVNDVIKNGEQFVYDDSEEYLTSLHRSGAEIILLTYTSAENLDYQKLKIQGSGLDKYFDDKIYTTTNKYLLDIDYKNSVFIDDHPDEVLGIYNKNAMQVIRIKRPDVKYSKIEINQKGIIEVSSLRELLSLKMNGLKKTSPD